MCLVAAAAVNSITRGGEAERANEHRGLSEKLPRGRRRKGGRALEDKEKRKIDKLMGAERYSKESSRVISRFLSLAGGLKNRLQYTGAEMRRSDAARLFLSKFAQRRGTSAERCIIKR